MANPTSRTVSYTSVLAATLEDRSPGFIDQVQKRIPLFFWLKKKNQYKTAEGETISWSIRNVLEQSDPSYSGLEVAGLQETDEFTVLRADWKQYRMPFIISGLDLNVKNRGPKIFDLFDKREEAALDGLQEAFGEHLYLDGTGNNNKRVIGLSAFCPEDPTTGTLFGVNRATAGNEYWRSRIVDHGGGAAHSGGTLSMRRGMEELQILCGRGKTGGKEHQFPDVAFCTEGYFRNYSDMLSTQQRFQNTMAADGGFTNLTFNGMTLMLDQDCPVDAESEDQAYFINSKFVEFRYAPAYNFQGIPPERPLDQDGFVGWIYWAGELTLLNANKQGLHFGIATI